MKNFVCIQSNENETNTEECAKKNNLLFVIDGDNKYKEHNNKEIFYKQI